MKIRTTSFIESTEVTCSDSVSHNRVQVLRVFRLLSSSLLLFPQRFGRYVLWPSSGVCQTREPSWKFELHPLLNPRRSPVLILLAINRVQVLRVFRLLSSSYIVISSTFRPICPLAFFRCLSNSGTFMEIRTTSFIESTEVTVF